MNNVQYYIGAGMGALVIIGIFILISLLLPWLNRLEISSLKEEIYRLDKEISRLRNISSVQEDNADDSPSNDLASHVWQARPAEIYEDIAAEEPPVYTVFPDEEQDMTKGRDQDAVKESFFRLPNITNMEFNFGAKLPVWLGAISLAFAGLFLMKYSIDAGFFGPLTRITLGGVFGVLLLLAGNLVIARPQMVNCGRISQALCGAGIVVLYICYYAALNLYQLISPLTAFSGMAGVTAVSVFLSLRIGAPVAAFGLLGGLLTPALVNTGNPDAEILFSYLFILFAGISLITILRGWWNLFFSSLVGVFSWTAIWALIGFHPDSAVQMVVLQVALTGLCLIATRKAMMKEGVSEYGRHILNVANIFALAGCSVSILLLGLMMEMTLFNWSVMGLITAAALFLTAMQPGLYRLFLTSKMCLDMVLFGVWISSAPIGDSLWVLCGLVALYGAVPRALARRDGAAYWAGLQSAALLAVYAISYFRLPVPDLLEERGFWGAAALLGAVYAIWNVRSFKAEITAGKPDAWTAMDIYALAGTCFISSGFMAELPREYLPAAFALQIFATCWIHSWSSLTALNPIIKGLCVLFIGFQHKGLAFLVTSIIDGLMLDRIQDLRVQDVPAHMALSLIIPSLLFWGGFYSLYRSRKIEGKVTDILFSISLILTLATIYIGLHITEYGVSVAPGSAFMQRGVMTLLIASASLAVMFLAPGRYQPWAKFLFGVFAFRLVYFDLLFQNPYFDGGQSVGAFPVLNGITMTYMGGFGMILAARKFLNPGFAPWQEKVLAGITLASLITFVSLTIRHAYQGDAILAGPMSNAELYTYSIVWILTSILLLAYSIIRDRRDVRLASLCFMILSICKVFLIDAADLEGLYRVFSFLGLGISLIGISYFYGRYTARVEKAD